jgi:Aldo/keto reductases, related to diketogulonate reductase
MIAKLVYDAKNAASIPKYPPTCVINVLLYIAPAPSSTETGTVEKVLGRALKKYGRENFFVATKVYGAHLRYDELQRAAEASIKRLGVDRIDLYQIHWPDPWEQIPMSQTFRAMKKLYEEGKIRAIGVSNFAVRDIEEARGILGDVPIVSNQVRYNLLQRNIEEEVIPYCKKAQYKHNRMESTGTGCADWKV